MGQSYSSDTIVIQGCQLAFLKLFARNKMYWSFSHFWASFECWRKKVNFKAFFEENVAFT